MNIASIEQSLQDLIESFDPQNPDNFIYELLLAYNLPKSSIARLKTGNLNISKDSDAILWKQKLLFKVVKDCDLHVTISQLKEEHTAAKQAPRFIIVTNYDTFLAIDTKTKDTLDTTIQDLAKHFDFFLPWAGMEKSQISTENAADRKAAEKMARLYDLISQDNPTTTREESHALNVFLSRLLFCFFAEDTDIFTDDIFTTGIDSHTQTDGSDLNTYLDRLFLVLNTDYPKRDKTLPDYLTKFPYVNGGLFKDNFPAPTFDHKSRQMLVELGSLDWAAINPDIFGSMMQGVILPSQRAHLGMHYTSVPNIMKVIEPLFLDDLHQEFEDAGYDPRKLNKLLERLGNLKIFDPACGSGNFLIIAYKELCKLEIKILQQLNTIHETASDLEHPQFELIPKAQLTLAQSYQMSIFSRIELSQFYGIEIDDFAHELAILSLWLAQHQMNLEFKQIFGSANPTLPLQAGGNIVHANACREHWEKLCPKNDGDEIYIFGNPPYLGTRNQKTEHKQDISFSLSTINNFKSLDYISIWFYKASNYILDANAAYAFVTTNSICQGDQVSILWNAILLEQKLEIGFAHQSFKWVNNAKANAGVTVLIIGIRNKIDEQKFIFCNNLKKLAKNINPYIVDAANITMGRLSNSISGLPNMIKGSIPADGGHLILTKSDYEQISTNSRIKAVTRKFIGAQEVIDNIDRWCLYIRDEEVEELKLIPEIRNRLDAVSQMRLNSTKLATQKLAKYPNRFAEDRYFNQECILIPCVTSGLRKYIPIAFVDKDPVIYASAQAIYNAPAYIFSIVSSDIHTIWIKSVCGRLKTDYRYSSTLGYNTFPFPSISEKQKHELDECAYRILDAREQHSEKTLAQLYDPEKMPENLRQAHHLNDLAIERCYRSKPFTTDEERLEYLFKLYEKMTTDESES